MYLYMSYEKNLLYDSCQLARALNVNQMVTLVLQYIHVYILVSSDMLLTWKTNEYGTYVSACCVLAFGATAFTRALLIIRDHNTSFARAVFLFLSTSHNTTACPSCSHIPIPLVGTYQPRMPNLLSSLRKPECK